MGPIVRYQYSRGLRVEYDKDAHELISLSLNGYVVQDNAQITVGIQDFYLSNIEKFLDVSLEEVSKIAAPRVMSTNSTDIVKEYFTHQKLVRASEERRLIIVNAD